MASKIEWTDRTWNPLAGCSIISKACDDCYAMKMAFRLEHMGQEKYKGTARKTESGRIIWTGKINLDDKALMAPLKWKNPQRVFVNSMSDLFHENVSFDFIDKVFVVMWVTPWNTYQILTKRPARMEEYFATNPQERWGKVLHNLLQMGFTGTIDFPLPNVWLGTTVEDQKTADERIPHLLKCPAVVRFLSCEPLLGPIRLDRLQREEVGFTWIDDSLTGFKAHGAGGWYGEKIHWVIAGGESGSKARPSHPDWFRSLRDQCQAANVPFFFKQWGEWLPMNGGTGKTIMATRSFGEKLFTVNMLDGSKVKAQRHDFCKSHPGLIGDSVKIGKHLSGNLLDGEVWNEFPKAGRNEGEK